MLLSIAFLPVSDVSTAFETLQKTCPETAHPIFNYFEDNYVGRLSAANGTRQNPRFDVDRWSCHQRVITGRPRTNNAVEGWNSNFVKLVNGKHPSKGAAATSNYNLKSIYFLKLILRSNNFQ